MNNLDRFDRMLLRAPSSSPPALPVTTMSVHIERSPVITSSRGPRFVDHTTCPMCGTDREGIEYHGQLMSGAKVHTIAAHTAGMRHVGSKQPRCLGSGMRIVFEGGVWKGLPTP